MVSLPLHLSCLPRLRFASTLHQEMIDLAYLCSVAALR
jgi:hypothetical protein